MRPHHERRAPAPWRNPVYVAATIAQAIARARRGPDAYGARELCRHLFPGATERRRRARPELPYLAITTMVHEGRDVGEWIEFHQLQGVERFYLYNNCASSEVAEAVDRYVAPGLVELTPWPDATRHTEAIADAFDRHRDDVRWLVYLDIDEFLFCPTGERIADVLKEYECYPAVAVHWNMFGTSDVARRPDGSEVLTTFVRRSEQFGPYSENRHVKCIVDPSYALEAPPPNPHNRPYRVGFAVNEIGCPTRGPRSWPIRAERLRINHYWSKSKVESLRKAARDWTPHSLSGLLSLRLNAVEDRTILEVRDRLRRGQIAAPRADYWPRTLSCAHDFWLANRWFAYLAVYRRLPERWRVRLRRPLLDWPLSWARS